MKAFIILISLIAVVIAEENGRAGITKIFKECMEKEEVTDKNITMGDIWKQMKYDNATQPIKCMQACILEKKNIMVPPDYKFDLDAAKKVDMKRFNVDEEKAKKLQDIFKECSEQVTSTERCQRAYEFLRCKMTKFQELGIKINKHKNKNHDENTEQPENA